LNLSRSTVMSQEAIPLLAMGVSPGGRPTHGTVQSEEPQAPMMRRSWTAGMGRIAGRGGLPGPTRLTGWWSGPTRLCPAGTGQQGKDRGQAPPESAGTVQRTSQAFPARRTIRSHSSAEMS